MVQLSRFTIRTSDRRTFRRCFRKWGLQASIRGNYERAGTETNIHFWFGTAIHFALEDYHGYNRFGDPRKALKAYYEAFDYNSLPDLAEEHYEMGIGMLTYYLEWYAKHNADMEFKTVFIKDRKIVPEGTPGARYGTEEKFYLDLGLDVIVDNDTEQIICEATEEEKSKLQAIPKFGIGLQDDEQETYWYPIGDSMVEVVIVPIHYHGTVDRVVVDKYGRYWIEDYKTAKSADTNKLDTDDQISAYIWAMEQWLQVPIYGFIYLQLTKDVAKPPRRLKNGTLSVDKSQRTTYQLVKEEIIKDYGSVAAAPNKILELLNAMAEYELPEGDRFIRWDFVRRTPAQIISTYNHIMGEAKLMIDPELYLYPNPTRDCIWDCPFRDICLAMDNDEHDNANIMLNQSFQKRPRHEDGAQEAWIERIKWPDEQGDEVEEEPDFTVQAFNVILPDVDEANSWDEEE